MWGVVWCPHANAMNAADFTSNAPADFISNAPADFTSNAPLTLPKRHHPAIPLSHLYSAVPPSCPPGPTARQFRRQEILARIETQLKLRDMWRVELKAAKSTTLLQVTDGSNDRTWGMATKVCL